VLLVFLILLSFVGCDVDIVVVVVAQDSEFDVGMLLQARKTRAGTMQSVESVKPAKVYVCAMCRVLCWHQLVTWCMCMCMCVCVYVCVCVCARDRMDE